MHLKQIIAEAAREQGLDLAGVARVEQFACGPDLPFFRDWLARGYHASMAWLGGDRAALRAEIGRLLPGVRSVICLAVNYNAPLPYSTALDDRTRGWISRYAWGEDYHEEFGARLEKLVERLRPRLPPFEARVCLDTSPVLERALARHAGVGWVGRNTCVINQRLGSWLFLGEVLTTLELEADAPAPDRCGSCTACVEACPTGALVIQDPARPGPRGASLPPHLLDSRRCISYWTIEEKGAIEPGMRAGIGRHVFGCDICQDVCPWNREAATTADPAFAPRDGLFDPPLEQLARITEDEFRSMFRHSAIRRAKYRGFLRNVCVAMGNSGDPKFTPELRRLAAHPDPLVSEHAHWALNQSGRARGPAGRPMAAGSEARLRERNKL